jgi:4-alpha-glucanotransferase
MSPTGRLSGVLFPIFSLRARDDFGIGDFGAAPAFLDWLKAAGQKLWMVLPLLPTAPGDASPYSCRCAFGLNPLFIDLKQIDEFRDAGGEASLTEAERKQLAEARSAERVRYDLVFPLKGAAFRRAFDRFEAKAPAKKKQAFEAFLEEQSGWLDSYALYAALSADQQQRPWWEWPKGLRERDAAALESARTRLTSEVRFHGWLQWHAHVQWAALRKEATARGVLMCGDEPFIIGQDSADVWANPKLLRRDARLGVPPDDFSATGQDWGLPYFDFAAMEKEGYAWLKYRARSAASYYDIRRVDHAVGYFRQYIRDQKTPKGRFLPPDETSQKAMGERHFKLLSADAEIIAEDLGVIPPFVRQILTKLELPGFKVLRWERDSLSDYRDPEAFPAVSLVCTGTHDTEPMASWWESCNDEERLGVVKVYAAFKGWHGAPREFKPEVHNGLLLAAESAGSDLCVLPWCDVLGTNDRINLPGSQSDANWAYRTPQLAEDLLKDPQTANAQKHLLDLTRAGKRI